MDNDLFPTPEALHKAMDIVIGDKKLKEVLQCTGIKRRTWNELRQKKKHFSLKDLEKFCVGMDINFAKLVVLAGRVKQNDGQEESFVDWAWEIIGLDDDTRLLLENLDELSSLQRHLINHCTDEELGLFTQILAAPAERRKYLLGVLNCSAT